MVVAVLGVVSMKWGNSNSAMAGAFFASMAALSSLFSLFFFYLENRRDQARTANEILKEGYSGRSEIFEQGLGREESAFANYCRSGVSVISFVFGVVLIAVAWTLRGRVVASEPQLAEVPLQVVAVTLLPLFLALFSGSYFSGLSREKGMRWFRASGCWLLCSALVFALSSLALLAEHFLEQKRDLDNSFASVLFIVLMVIGAEILLGIILDIYRPGREPEEKPAFESKILAIIFQPGGIARNIAEVVNYQFGFSVSDTWFFKVTEKTLLPFVVITALLGYLMTSVVYIDSDSQGIREFCGRVVSKDPLTPGVYFKLPYPFGEIRRFPVKKVQEFSLGYTTDDKHKSSEVVVWTRSHVSNEENFLLPDSRSGVLGSDSIAVSFVTVRIPVRYVVKDLYSYLYNFRDAGAILQRLAQAETLAYLANTDFFYFFSVGRLEASEELTRRIQGAADKAGLGIDVVYVNLLATHPPVVVGDAFQKVTSAMEKKEALILDAMAYANRVIPEAEGKAAKLLKEAEGYKYRIVKVAKAEEIRFRNQLKAYNEFKEFYTLSREMELMEQTAGRRKYIVPANFPTDIFTINLEDKLSPDLFDMNITPATDK